MSEAVKFEGDVLEGIKKVLPEIDFSKIEGDITLDVINEAKGKSLVTREVHDREISSAVGRITGAGQTAFGRILGDAAKGKEYKDLLPALETAFTEQKQRIDELSKGAKSDLTEKERKELTDLKKLVQDQEAAILAKDGEISKINKDVEDRVSAIIMKNEVDVMFERITWVDNVSKFAKEGIRESVNRNYAFKKDGDKILVYDKEGGVVKNGNGTGHMEARELFEGLAKSDGLLKQNGAATGRQAPPIPKGNDGKPLSAKAQAHYERMTGKGQ